jgi:hypothetical protein
MGHFCACLIARKLHRMFMSLESEERKKSEFFILFKKEMFIFFMLLKRNHRKHLKMRLK